MNPNQIPSQPSPSLRIILASQSESRKKALNILGLTFECIPPHIDEKAIRDPNLIKMALMISEAKALEIGKLEKGIIIAGDAFIIFDNKVFEKPSSAEEGEEMLKTFSGNKIIFLTGLAVYDTYTKKMRSSVTTCEILFRRLSEDEIKDYCSRYPVTKFAGSFESDGVALFGESIEGSCINETSLSLKDLISFLNEIKQDHFQAS